MRLCPDEARAKVTGQQWAECPSEIRDYIDALRHDRRDMFAAKNTIFLRCPVIGCGTLGERGYIFPCGHTEDSKADGTKG